jgi:hypothetical protein
VRYRLATLTCDGGSFPAQWEGTTEDHRPVYVRFRWGRLVVHVGQPGSPEALADDSIVPYDAQIGGPYDGVLSTEEMLRYAKVLDASGLR